MLALTDFDFDYDMSKPGAFADFSLSDPQIFISSQAELECNHEELQSVISAVFCAPIKPMHTSEDLLAAVNAALALVSPKLEAVLCDSEGHYCDVVLPSEPFFDIMVQMRPGYRIPMMN